jgi:hypothetical protein
VHTVLAGDKRKQQEITSGFCTCGCSWWLVSKKQAIFSQPLLEPSRNGPSPLPEPPAGVLVAAGDVNFFFNDHEDRSTAEIEIMIAEPSSRRKGIASEALQLFMAYGVSALGVTRFRAKIGEGNASSLQLFAKLGYSEVSRSAVFKEVTLELPVEGEVRERLTAAAQQLHLGVYDA